MAKQKTALWLKIAGVVFVIAVVVVAVMGSQGEWFLGKAEVKKRATEEQDMAAKKRVREERVAAEKKTQKAVAVEATVAYESRIEEGKLLLMFGEGAGIGQMRIEDSAIDDLAVPKVFSWDSETGLSELTWGYVLEPGAILLYVHEGFDLSGKTLRIQLEGRDLTEAQLGLSSLRTGESILWDEKALGLEAVWNQMLALPALAQVRYYPRTAGEDLVISFEGVALAKMGIQDAALGTQIRPIEEFSFYYWSDGTGGWIPYQPLNFESKVEEISWSFPDTLDWSGSEINLMVRWHGKSWGDFVGLSESLLMSGENVLWLADETFDLGASSLWLNRANLMIHEGAEGTDMFMDDMGIFEMGTEGVTEGLFETGTEGIGEETEMMIFY